MRDLLLWGSAVLFLLAALFTVAVRREVYELARENGRLERDLEERVRQRENLALDRERLGSPARLRQVAARAGIAPRATEAAGR